MSECQMSSAGKIEHGAALDAGGELGARLAVVGADAVGLADAEAVVTAGRENSGVGVTDSDALEPCALLHDESTHTAATAPAMPLL